jgi:hypothetical protein
VYFNAHKFRQGDICEASFAISEVICWTEGKCVRLSFENIQKTELATENPGVKISEGA